MSNMKNYLGMAALAAMAAEHHVPPRITHEPPPRPPHTKAVKKRRSQSAKAKKARKQNRK